MILPKVYKASAFVCAGFVLTLLSFSNGYPQAGGCGAIEKIKTEVTASLIAGQKDLKLVLPVDLKFSELEIHLFAPKRENNRTDVKAVDIVGLLPGKYYLIIQKKGDNCIKKISVEI